MVTNDFTVLQMFAREEFTILWKDYPFIDEFPFIEESLLMDIFRVEERLRRKTALLTILTFV